MGNRGGRAGSAEVGVIGGAEKVKSKRGVSPLLAEAAQLFRPHAIEGWYSGLKRALGQFKGPFGDIVIDAARFGEKELTVLAAHVGEHVGQSTFRAASRYVRRLLIWEYGFPRIATLAENFQERPSQTWKALRLSGWEYLP